MRFPKNSNIKVIYIFTVVVMLLTACTNDDPLNPQEQAPVVPPQSTFIMDFNDFPDTSSPAIFPKVQLGDTVSFANWGWSATNILVWNSILTLTLAVPVAAFAESFNHEPVLQPDDSWLWSYNVSVFGIVHTAKLFGKNTNEGVEWTMLISKDGVYTDFEWYTGLSSTTGTEGTWTLNKNPDNPVKFLFIEWHRNEQEGTADIKYTNIVPDDPENGGYIFYGKTSELTYNTFYDIFNKGQNNHTYIEWNHDTHNGRVQDLLHFSDNDWHCWDENLYDVICP